MKFRLQGFGSQLVPNFPICQHEMLWLTSDFETDKFYGSEIRTHAATLDKKANRWSERWEQFNYLLGFLWVKGNPVASPGVAKLRSVPVIQFIRTDVYNPWIRLCFFELICSPNITNDRLSTTAIACKWIRQNCIVWRRPTNYWPTSTQCTDWKLRLFCNLCSTKWCRSTERIIR